MVSKEIALLTATSKPCLTVSSHTAPRKFSRCHRYLQRHFGCCFIVMAMSMKKLEVIPCSRTSESKGRYVVGLQCISMFEIQSAPWAFPFLLFQELCFPCIKQGVFAHTCCPVDKISIKRAFLILNFNMAFDVEGRVFE